MKTLTLSIAVTSLLSIPALAQQHGKLLPHQNANKVSPFQAIQPGAIKGADYKGYKFTRLPMGVDASTLNNANEKPLFAGTEMVNTITGKPAYVSGVISVVLTQADPDEIAAQLGLVVDKRYDRMNVALLRAPEGTDMLALKQQLKHMQGVSGADIEVVEELRQPD
ncbi:hypothetical protein CWI84_06360 [Idiomarina tyrosinivorans]|uniref:ASP external chaperone domain-containing protein n=1 Tax=Idiomarina tyrosinivorans TaxID=1445662 RepID=A0A432ZQZ4_9GAMM|nr:hypothetical protein [Idiomarina tyrosinivorans]RUO80251.1 hypothetical protein CWI84_06360 [Idiomarina tyrosinivorans]